MTTNKPVNPMNNDNKNPTEKTKEHMDDMKKVMNEWYKMMHDLYLMISSVLITLSVAAIGFVASYILEDGYHSNKYDTCFACISLFCASIGGLLLIFSCACGLTHLRKNLIFIQCNAEHFAECYMKATKMHYQESTETHIDTADKTYECKSPCPFWWNAQICLFGCGIILLVAWIVFDFLTTG